MTSVPISLSLRGRSIAILSLIAAAGLALAAQAQPTFRGGVDLVTVNVTVTDRAGHFVSGLTQDDFTVFEDGQRRPVAYFEGEATPVSLGILLDASGSMAEAKFAKLDLARQVVARLVTHDIDSTAEWMFARFTSAVVVAREWTTDREAIVQPLRETRATGDTSLYDAIALSIPLVKEGHFQKKALLVVTDGGETKSLVTQDEVRKAIGESDVRVYGVGVRAKMDSLRKIADETGGRTEAVNDAAAIPAATARIADQLRHQYLLGYSTNVAKDGRPHAIRVESRRGGLELRSRKQLAAE